MLPPFFYARSREHRTSMLLALKISCTLLLLSGLISIFTPFRLAKFITSGFSVIPGTRMQHFAGNILGVDTYLPVGLMNTHLTFGGLLGLFFPGVNVYIFYNFRRFNLLQKLGSLGFFGLYSLVLVYNQSRSIWAGIIFLSIIFFFRFRQRIFNHLSYRKIFVILLLFSSLLAVSGLIYTKNWLIQRALKDSVHDNTTENQRYFIHKNSLEILKDRFIMGVGSGRFPEEHWLRSQEMISADEKLWYELYVTPRSHAHHDFIHFYAIGGIVTGVLFLFLWIYLAYRFHKNRSTYFGLSFVGVFILFVAGFFQCYLLDDEVALPFFAFCGLMLGGKPNRKFKYKKYILSRAKNRDTFATEIISVSDEMFYRFKFMFLNVKIRSDVFSFFSVMIPLVFSIIWVVTLINKDTTNMYKRKIFSMDPVTSAKTYISLNPKKNTITRKQAEDGVFVEGCLTHRFTDPVSIRKTPFKIIAKIPEMAENPPTRIRVEAYERDTFDQDQLYKVHEFRKLNKEFRFDLKPGENPLIFDGLQSKTEATSLPNNIFFVDYKIFPEGYDASKPEVTFPGFDFGKLCDAF